MSLHNQFHKNIDLFLGAYALVGELEMTLRERVPLTLSKHFGVDRHNWYSELKLDEKSRLRLDRALQINRKNPESALTFSFWRYLFISSNYGNLWLPVLHKVFPELDYPKNLASFKLIERNLHSTLKLRNDVAHYNLGATRNLTLSIRNAQWILDQMTEKFN